MPLKLKKSQTPSEPSSTKDDLSGPWGEINPEPQSVVVLRLCKKTSPYTEETHSYPYRALSCWHWRGGVADETLEIEAGSDLVTVKGRGLDRLVEALDLGTLKILCEGPVSEKEPVRISSIMISHLTTELLPS
jgi:hypothetical protein